MRSEAGQLAMTYSYSTSIEHELDGNERLLWKGRPRSAIRLRSSDAYLIPFSLVWAGFAIVWEFAAIMKIPKTDPATWIFPLAGVPFVLSVSTLCSVVSFWTPSCGIKPNMP